MSVGAISPIGGVDSVSYAAPVNNSFRISNRSAVSDAYKNRIQENTGAGKIEPVDPVRYADASMQTQSVSKSREVQEASKAFNDIAKNFANTNTGYNSAAAAATYSTVGSQFDMFA